MRHAVVVIVVVVIVIGVVVVQPTCLFIPFLSEP
jgi:hypothetical protein